MKESNKSLQYICLFADVFVVEGSAGALLISYKNKKMYEISSSVAYITRQFPDYSVAEIWSQYGELGEKLQSYFDFLIKNQLGFYTNNPQNFPPIDDVYMSPTLIDNCIIEIGDKMNASKFRFIIEQLSALGAESMELRFYDACNLNTIRTYIQQLDNSTISGVDLIIKYHESLEEDKVAELTIESQRIAVIYIHSAPEDKFLSDVKQVMSHDLGLVFYTTQAITSHACCGQISKAALSLGGLITFIHNRKANSCLNKKISIDLDGNIKNCPSLPEVYGHIDRDRLYNIAKKKAFKKYWDITKDEIEICRDCKYRYLCTDCRAFTSDTGNPYSKPAKCHYDPYTDVWSDASKMSEGIKRYQTEK